MGVSVPVCVCQLALICAAASAAASTHTHTLLVHAHMCVASAVEIGSPTFCTDHAPFPSPPSSGSALCRPQRAQYLQYSKLLDCVLLLPRLPRPLVRFGIPFDSLPKKSAALFGQKLLRGNFSCKVSFLLGSFLEVPGTNAQQLSRSVG